MIAPTYMHTLQQKTAPFVLQLLKTDGTHFNYKIFESSWHFTFTALSSKMPRNPLVNSYAATLASTVPYTHCKQAQKCGESMKFHRGRV